MCAPQVTPETVRRMRERTTNAGPPYPLSDFFRELPAATLDGAVRSDIWAHYLVLCGRTLRPEVGRNEFYRRLERVHGLRVVTVRGVRRYRLSPAEGTPARRASVA